MLKMITARRQQEDVEEKEYQVTIATIAMCLSCVVMLLVETWTKGRVTSVQRAME